MLQGPYKNQSKLYRNAICSTFFLLHFLLFQITQLEVGGRCWTRTREDRKLCMCNRQTYTFKFLLLLAFLGTKETTEWKEVEDGGPGKRQMFLLDEISDAQGSKIFVSMVTAR